MGDADDQKMCGMLRGGVSKAKPYLLMVGLQFGSAGMYIITMVTLNRGMSRFVLIVYRNAVAAIVLAPFALFFERKIRPKMTISIFFKIMVLGFLEPILDQNLTFLGMKYTSASYASAIMNAVPSVTFVIATILRLERVKIKSTRGQAKVFGTLVTFAGALAMTLYKGPVIDLVWSHKSTTNNGSSTNSSDKNWLIGTALILVGCFAWSCFYVLQSITMRTYPAELSLSSLICLVGALQSAALAVVVEHHPSAWSIGWDSRLLAPLYTGIVTSGITYYVQGLVMKKRGPVFVTAFNPLCMIIVAALGSVILAEQLHLGSIIGGIIIAIGLYSVVWGKSKDHIATTTSPSIGEKSESTHDQLPITASTNPPIKLITPASINGEFAETLDVSTKIKMPNSQDLG